MGKITRNHIEKSYEIAVKVFRKEITLKTGLDKLVDLGMNRNSASDYVYNYGCMMEGKLMTRNASVLGTRYFLEKIYEENAIEGLERALISLSRHLEYYEQVSNTNVVERRKIYNEFLSLVGTSQHISFSDEINDDEPFLEGKSKRVYVNAFERNPIARKKCIDFYGAVCKICEFDFEKVYGPIGKGFIHVHHIVDISSIGSEYELNPIIDLTPVCPNCHAMLHKRKPSYSVNEIKEILMSHSN